MNNRGLQGYQPEDHGQRAVLPPPRFPNGTVLVTQEMIDAAEQVEDLYKRGTPQTWVKVFRAMLAASPRE